MRSVAMAVVALAMAGGGLCFAAERTGENEHPIRKTALAQADSEIALKDGAAAFEKESASKSVESTRVAVGQVLQRYEKAIERESAKTEDMKDKLLLEQLERERQAKSTDWSEDERKINTLAEQAGKLEQQFQNLQATFQNATQMLEAAKKTDLSVELAVPIYVAITEQAGKVTGAYKQVADGLDVFLKKWETIALEAKAKF